MRVTVSADGAQVDALCDRLEALGAASVSIEARGDEQVLEPAPGEAPMWAMARVSALFDAAHNEAGLHRQLQKGLGALGINSIDLAPVQSQDWVGAWRRDAVAQDYGHGLWVLPHHVPNPASARTAIRLDPGLAFGTGSHPTTSLCLRWLAPRDLTGCTVLDLGCGSGILAIAAAKLGARHVIAVDNDPQALRATASNAKDNTVADRVSVSPSLPPQRVDVVLANILANTLVQFAPAIATSSVAGAQIALSGILSEQIDEVWVHYRDEFCKPEHVVCDGWALLAAQRR